MNTAVILEVLGNARIAADSSIDRGPTNLRKECEGTIWMVPASAHLMYSGYLHYACSYFRVSFSNSSSCEHPHGLFSEFI